MYILMYARYKGKSLLLSLFKVLMKFIVVYSLIDTFTKFDLGTLESER